MYVCLCVTAVPTTTGPPGRAAYGVNMITSVA